MRRVRVAIYGGGIGGLSAAHELAKCGSHFEIDVYEAGQCIGGKAASQYIEGTAEPGRRDLPGEHGFRFFPAFYYHLDRTMAEIPCGVGRHVSDNLVGSESFAIARNGRRPAVAQRRVRDDVDTVAGAVELLYAWYSQEALGLSSADLTNLVYSVTKFMMSSEVRRARQYDRLSWYEFSNSHSDGLSDDYRSLVSSLPRTMVAMDGRNGSAYTIGKAGSQLFFLDPMRANGGVDRVLNGPTSESWLEPWHRYLRARGVRFHHGARLERLSVDEREGNCFVAGGHLMGGESIDADFHICALPLEAMIPLIDADIAGLAPSLGRVRKHLSEQTAWMVGAQYFLRRDIKVAHGHVIYPDSPWALSSISQAQFWKRSGGPIEDRYGSGEVRGILSVDISNWDAVAPRLGRPAKDCTRQEILDETFRQILEGLNNSDARTLDWDDVLHRHLDSNIEFERTDGRASGNRTPLLVHAPGTYEHRPSSRTELRNLFLASDYVATHTNLATMEGANEAARRAVRGILTELNWSRELPIVRDLPEPVVFEPFKRLDSWLMQHEKSFEHVFRLQAIELSELVEAAHRLSQGVSIPALRRSVGRMRSGPMKGRRDATRTRATLRHFASALTRAEGLASRRTFLVPRGRKSGPVRPRRTRGEANTERAVSELPPPG